MAISMWSVPSGLRPLAMSLMTIAIHLFGDVPSPPLLGWLQGQLEDGKAPTERAQQWRVSMGLFSLLLMVSGTFFLSGWRVARHAVDYRKAEPREAPDEEGPGDVMIRDPLLGGGGVRSSSSGGGDGSSSVMMGRDDSLIEGRQAAQQPSE